MMKAKLQGAARPHGRQLTVSVCAGRPPKNPSLGADGKSSSAARRKVDRGSPGASPMPDLTPYVADNTNTARNASRGRGRPRKTQPPPTPSSPLLSFFTGSPSRAKSPTKEDSPRKTSPPPTNEDSTASAASSRAREPTLSLPSVSLPSLNLPSFGRSPAPPAVTPQPKSPSPPAASTVAADLAPRQPTIDLTPPPSPPKEEEKWARETYDSAERLLDIQAFFTVFKTWFWSLEQQWTYPGGYSDAKRSARTRLLGKYLVTSVQKLGPAFIKMGEIAASRGDLFPREWTEELSKLQDTTPAFSVEKARSIIEKELGRPVKQIFASFDPEPVSSGSLGQIHRAVLKDGTEVVVKVQRPGLKQLWGTDLSALRVLTESLDKESGSKRDWKAIFQEAAKVLYEEIDYTAEAQACERFRANFADVPWVRVPEVFREYSTGKVLTMSYLRGTPVTDRAALGTQDLNTDLIAQRVTEAYITQLLKHGFFYVDPQPGNVSVDAAGNLIFYDFGAMTELPPQVKEQCTELFEGVMRKDTTAVIRSLIALGVVSPTADMSAIRRAVGYFIDTVSRKAERYESLSVIADDVLAVAGDQPFRIPLRATLALRSFITMEEACRALDPEYAFTRVAGPYVTALLAQGSGALMLSPGGTLNPMATEAAAAVMPVRVKRMEQILTGMESGDVRLRVRMEEAELVAKRSGVMQAAILNVVGAMGFLNLGTALALADMKAPAAVCLGLGSILSVSTWQGFRRIETIDKDIKDLQKQMK